MAPFEMSAEITYPSTYQESGPGRHPAGKKLDGWHGGLTNDGVSRY